MPARDISYFTSEQFIWDDLIKDVERTEKRVYKSWAEDNNVGNFAITWPSEKIQSDDGLPITRMVLMDLPDDRTTWSKKLQNMVVRTKAYALLLVEQKTEEAVLILESHHGTRSWHYPIERHGPDRVLGKPIIKSDTDCIGLLWQPSMASN